MSEEKLVELFKDTLKLSTTEYREETNKAIQYIKLYDNLRLVDTESTTNIAFDMVDSTVTEIFKVRQTENGKIAALNFADSMEPGGLVWQGETTQEECLCRSSNLYLTLIADMNKKYYYEYNKQFKGKGSNRIIYSPNVLFFKDSQLNKVEPVTCDIITSPAPIYGTATKEEIIERMTMILSVAKDNNVETLILGNWGCGAFGNNRVEFAEYWKESLKRVHINKVIFATIDNYDDIKRVLV